MQNQQQRVVRDLFEQALVLPPEAQAEWLQRHCGHDPALHTAVHRLLRAARQSGSFLTGPALRREHPPAPTDKRIGHYRILREIGSGGMGVVYLAARADGAFEHLAALKVIRPMFQHPPLLERFRRERQILARLDHPNIARILDGGTTDDGLPYFLMDYVDGEPIDVFCRRRRSTLTQRLNLFRQACQTVQYLHSNQVIHRDLKPANILVTHGGMVKLLDFGIAKVLDANLTDVTAGASLMTPGYASPEQLMNAPVGPASDIYSLGVVLFFLLTDRLPHDLEELSLEERLRVLREEPAPSPARLARERAAAGDLLPVPGAEIGSGLDHIVLMALRKEPERRFPSAAAMAADIDRFQSLQPVTARGNSPGYLLGRFSRRNRWPIAAALVLAASLGWAATASVFAWRARNALHSAQHRLSDAATVLATANRDHRPVPAEIIQHALGLYTGDVQHVAAPLLARPFPPRSQERAYVQHGLQFLSEAAPHALLSPFNTAELEEAYLATAQLQWNGDRPSLDDASGASATCRTVLDLLHRQPDPASNDHALAVAQALKAYCGSET